MKYIPTRSHVFTLTKRGNTYDEVITMFGNLDGTCYKYRSGLLYSLLYLAYTLISRLVFVGGDCTEPGHLLGESVKFGLIKLSTS